MKNILNYLLIIITSINISCESESQKKSVIQSEISGAVESYSECKNQKNVKLNYDTPDNLSCIEYIYNPETEILTLTHINAGFNCCPENIYCTVSFDSIQNTITIEEFEEAALCNCNCLYDVTIEIKGILATQYRLIFIEPYLGEQEEIDFTINLDINNSGSHCVTRTLYPWAIQTQISGKIESYSECKNKKNGYLQNEIPNNLSCIEYTYQPNSKTLSLKHINAGFNCCPENIFCTVSFNSTNNSITIEEFEGAALCDCNCLYDLNIEISEIQAKQYQIIIIEPYIQDQQKFEFDIFLNSNDTGSYCVPRTIYPWI